MKKLLIMAGVIMVSMVLASSFILAKEKGTKKSLKNIPSAKIIYQDGYLRNIGEEPALRCEIVSPFYKYIGNINPGKRVDISYIKTKFTISYLIPDWLGEYTQVKETFLPKFKYKTLIAPEVRVRCQLKDSFLEVELIADRKLKNVTIEIPPEIPVKISETRTRYITSQVLVLGPNVIYGQRAEFKIISLSNAEYSTVPIKIIYQYQGIEYQELLFYSFRTER
jgi:hypothetical protein